MFSIVAVAEIIEKPFGGVEGLLVYIAVYYACFGWSML